MEDFSQTSVHEDENQANKEYCNLPLTEKKYRLMQCLKLGRKLQEGIYAPKGRYHP